MLWTLIRNFLRKSTGAGELDTLIAQGTELLSRYERKGFAEVVGAREPFLQTARVTLENVKAEYQDKLDAARAKPQAGESSAAATR